LNFEEFLEKRRRLLLTNTKFYVLKKEHEDYNKTIIISLWKKTKKILSNKFANIN